LAPLYHSVLASAMKGLPQPTLTSTRVLLIARGEFKADFALVLLMATALAMPVIIELIYRNTAGSIAISAGPSRKKAEQLLDWRHQH
jgi:hypothetical protein